VRVSASVNKRKTPTRSERPPRGESRYGLRSARPHLGGSDEPANNQHLSIVGQLKTELYP